MIQKVMLIETEQKLAPSLRPLMEAARLGLVEADGLESALSRLMDDDVPVVLVNIENLAQAAIPIIKEIKRTHPDIALITLNDPNHMDLSFQAMRLGVSDDLLIPLDSKKLIASIHRALKLE